MDDRPHGRISRSARHLLAGRKHHSDDWTAARREPEDPARLTRRAGSPAAGPAALAEPGLPSQPIAVVGVGCRFPEADDPADLLDVVLTGRRAFRRLPPVRLCLSDYYSPDPATADATYCTRAALIEGWHFDGTAFGLSEDAVAAADPAHWLALETAARALAGAGMPGGSGLGRARTGVLLASSLAGDPSRAAELRLRWPVVRRLLSSAVEDSGLPASSAALVLGHAAAQYLAALPGIDGELARDATAGSIAARICGYFGFGGGAQAIAGSDAAALLAVASACTALAAGELDAALAGGVDLRLDPVDLVSLAKTGLLATTDVRIYDEHPTGFLPGEGCGVVVLMRARDARRAGLPVYAEIVGWGLSSAAPAGDALDAENAGAAGAAGREADSLLLAMTRAYQRAHVDPADLRLMEGDGSGTAGADAAELRALAALRAGARIPLALGSVKANIGHARAAAGAAGLIKTVLALSNGLIPAATGVCRPHPLVRDLGGLVQLPAATARWPEGTRLAGVTAMAADGLNVHLVLRREEPGSHSGRREGPGGRGSDPAAFPEAAEKARLPCPRRHPAPVLAGANSGAGRPAAFFVHAPDRASMLALLERISAIARWLSDSELRDLACQLAGDAAEPGRVRVALAAARQEQLAALAGEAATVVNRMTDGVLALRPGIAAADGACGAVTVLLSDGSRNHAAGSRPWAQQLSVLAWLDWLGTAVAAAVGHGDGEIAGLVWAGSIAAADAGALAARRNGQRSAESAELPVAAPRRRLFLASTGSELTADNTETSVLAPPPATSAGLHDVLRAGASGASLLLESGPGRTLTEAATAWCPVPALSMDTGTGDERALARAACAVFAAGALAKPARLYAGQPTRPFNLHRELSFVPGPFRELSEQAGRAGLAGAPARRAGQPRMAAHPAGSARRAGRRADSGLFLPGRGQPDSSAEPESRSAPGISAALSGPAAGCGAPQPGPGSAAARPAAIRGTASQADEPASEALADRVARIVTAGWRDSRGQPASPAAQAASGSQGRAAPAVTPPTATPAAAVTAAPGSPPAAAPGSAAPAAPGSPPAAAPGSPPAAAPGSAAPAAPGSAVPARSPRPGSAVLVPGAGPWLRCYAEELRRPALPSPRPTTGAWRVRAATTPELGRLTQELFPDDPASRCALAVVGDPTRPDCCAVALMAGRDAMKAGQLVLVTHGAGFTGFCASLHAEYPHLGVTVLRVPESPGGLRAARDAAAAEPGEFRELVIDPAGEVLAPLMVAQDLTDRGAFPMGPDDVVLVSRGARGAGLALAHVLACCGAPVAVIGRRGQGEDRAIVAGLRRLAKAGARVTFEEADIASPLELASALDRIEREFGPVTVVSHAVGAAFHRPFAELTDSAVRSHIRAELASLSNLLGAIRSRQLRMITTFGSITGRYGLAGEALLALASGALAEHAARLAASLPGCRALHVDWPAWDGDDLNERPDLARRLADAGTAAVPVADGARLLLKALSMPAAASMPGTGASGAKARTGRIAVHGRISVPERTGPPEPADGGASGGEACADDPRSDGGRPLARRFLERTRVSYPGVELVCEARISLRTDPYLSDYRVDGMPVLPATMALEAMAEAAAALAGRPLRRAHDVAVAAPVVIPAGTSGGQIVIRICALRNGRRVTTVLRCADDDFTVDHYRAVFSPADEEAGRPAATRASAMPDLVEVSASDIGIVDGTELYGPVCFQSGRLRRAALLPEVTARSCRAIVRGGDDQPWFDARTDGSSRPRFLLGSPGLNDASWHVIQACVPHRRVLPAGCDEVTFSGAFASGAVEVRAVEVAPTGIDVMPDRGESVWDAEATDAAGRILVSWRGLRLADAGPLPRNAAWPPSLLSAYLERSAIALGLDPGLRVFVRCGPPEVAGLAPGASLVPRPSPAGDSRPAAPPEGALAGFALGVRAPTVAVCGWAACEPNDITRPSGSAGLAAAVASASRQLGETAAVSRGRLRAIASCLAAAGVPGLAPQSREHGSCGGWIRLDAGDAAVACTVVEMSGVSVPVAIAIMTGVQAAAGIPAAKAQEAARATSGAA
jgi:enediyne polyketide synthase